jgi:hypothetical protein
MIVNKGLQRVASLFAGQTWQLAIGRGSTAPWVTNTTLENQYAKQDATASIETTAVANDTVKIEKVFEFFEAVTIYEYGLFHKSSGDLICRWVQTGIDTVVGYRLGVELYVQIRR